jgi:hypothetical protein
MGNLRLGQLLDSIKRPTGVVRETAPVNGSSQATLQLWRAWKRNIAIRCELRDILDALKFTKIKRQE